MCKFTIALLTLFFLKNTVETEHNLLCVRVIFGFSGPKAAHKNVESRLIQH